MMINDEVVWNFTLNENYYENFPLASKFEPPYIELPPKFHFSPHLPHILRVTLNGQGNENKPC